MNKKIDPFLIIELEEVKRQQTGEEKSVDVLIRYQGENVQPILDVGLILVYKSKLLLGGSISLLSIPALAELEQVLFIQASQEYDYELDLSISETRADKVRSVDKLTHDWTGYTGKGVIVAIIDSGINYLHKSFRKLDGTTRILWIWDMTLTPETPINPANPQSSPPPFNLPDGTAVVPNGVEYSKANIDAALTKSSPHDYVKHKDSGLHGSHVSGIAAGNGLQYDSCVSNYSYVGVAPESDIIFVKGDRSNDLKIMQAIAYIVSKAGSTPFVINMSFGNNLGPHDGTELDAREIDRLLSGGNGRAVVKSAGNQGNKRKHFTQSLSGNSTLNITFKVLASSTKKIEIDLWYDAAANIDVSITPSGDSAKGPVTYGNNQSFNVNNGGRIRVFNLTGATNGIGDGLTPDTNLDNRIRIFLRPNRGTNASGNWVISLTSTNASAATVHCWIKRRHKAIFNGSSRSTTITNPGNSDKIITVGSYNMRKGWWGEQGELSKFSSFGKTRDGRDKPEISAPGASIRSAEGREHGCCEKFWCWCCNRQYHRDTQGTSMAAPHVAGAVALMLEKDPTLSIDNIKLNLIVSARRDSFTGDSPDQNKWGFGKLDIKAALDLVTATTPSPSPSLRNVEDGESVITLNPSSLVTDELSSSPSETELQNLYQKFMQTSTGRSYTKLAEQYADEVWELVNHNKRVATVWHRNGGKKIISLTMRLLSNPSDPIPIEIDEIKTRTRLENIATIFHRYGSKPLQEDILNSSQEFYSLIGLSFNQIIHNFSKDNPLQKPFSS